VNDLNTTLLRDGQMYDIIVDVVGDETGLEFCTLVDYYLEDNDLDLCMNVYGTHWEDIKPLIDEIEERAAEKRSQDTGTDRSGGGGDAE